MIEQYNFLRIQASSVARIKLGNSRKTNISMEKNQCFRYHIPTLESFIYPQLELSTWALLMKCHYYQTKVTYPAH